MIVRATRIRTSPRGAELAQHSALRVGGDYLVLEVTCSPKVEQGPIMFRILDEENDPTMWPSDCFELVDGRIPSSWVVGFWDTGAVVLGPKRWQSPEFWEEYFDALPGAEAVRIFQEELGIIRAG